MTRRLNIPFAEQFASAAIGRPVVVEVTEPKNGADGCIGPAHPADAVLHIKIHPRVLLDVAYLVFVFLHECVHGIGNAAGKHDYIGSRRYTYAKLAYDFQVHKPLDETELAIVADRLTPWRIHLFADWYRYVEARTSAEAELWASELEAARLAAGLGPFWHELVDDPEVNEWDEKLKLYLQEVTDDPG